MAWPCRSAPPQAAALQQLVTLPLQAPQLFAAYNITPPRGVLLYGPPGEWAPGAAAPASAGSHVLYFYSSGAVGSSGSLAPIGMSGQHPSPGGPETHALLPPAPQALARRCLHAPPLPPREPASS